jgi:hypothetical protein
MISTFTDVSIDRQGSDQLLGQVTWLHCQSVLANIMADVAGEVATLALSLVFST